MADLMGQVSTVVEHGVGSSKEDLSGHRYAIVFRGPSVVPGEAAISIGVKYIFETLNGIGSAVYALRQR